MLCKDCSGKMYIMNIGVCVMCAGHTSSGAFKLCRKCSQQRNECMHCRAKLSGSSSDQKKS